MVAPAQIRVLVRAQVRQDIITSNPRPPRLSPLQAANPIARKAAAEAGAAKRRAVRTSEYLDMHLDSDTLLRVDGRTMSFAVLGDLQGHSAKPNTDQLFGLLAHLAPGRIRGRYG